MYQPKYWEYHWPIQRKKRKTVNRWFEDLHVVATNSRVWTILVQIYDQIQTLTVYRMGYRSLASLTSCDCIEESFEEQNHSCFPAVIVWSTIWPYARWDRQRYQRQLWKNKLGSISGYLFETVFKAMNFTRFLGLLN